MCDWAVLRRNMAAPARADFARQFIALGLAETDGTPHFVMGIIRNGASYLQVSKGELKSANAVA